MEQLQDLTVAENVSSAFNANDRDVAIKVTTSESSTIVIHRSIDNTDFRVIPDLSWTIDGIDEINLTDCKKGQFYKVVATAGVMTAAKVLA